MRLFLSVVVVVSAIAPVVLAQAAQPPEFSTQVVPVFPDGTWVGVAVGDMDKVHPGNEVVVVDGYGNRIRIGKIGSDGQWTQLQDLAIGPYAAFPSSALVSPTIVDINGDSDNDIVLWRRGNNQQGRLVLLVRSGSAFIESSYPTPETDAAYTLAVGDVNGDGLPDVITANHGHSAPPRVFVLLNAADSSRFTSQGPSASTPSARIQNVFAADLNGDGRVEVLATTNAYGSNGVLLFDNPAGALVDSVLLSGASVTFDAAAADIGGDGLTDVVGTETVAGGNRNVVNIYRRTALGYSPAQQLTPGYAARNPRFGDFNGDGFPDLALAVAVERTLAFYFSNAAAAGVLASTPFILNTPELNALEHFSGTEWQNLKAADIDNDGDTDLIFAAQRVVFVRNGPVLSGSDLVPPVVTGLAATPNPAAAGASIQLSAIIDDTATGGSAIASAAIVVDDAQPLSLQASDGQFNGANEAVTGSLPGFAAAGLHRVCVTGSDAAGNTSVPECILVPIYDPSAGFVTGGGTMNSPPGADIQNPGTAGHATFGFVSKYQKAATTPSGNLEFQFKAGDLHFRSTGFEWLVVTSEPRAQFRGDGILNGTTTCKFQVDAWDGSFSGTDAFGLHIYGCSGAGGDRYRLEASSLRTGSIIIHRD